MVVLAVGGGIFLTAILEFVIWVDAFRREEASLSNADETQRIRWGEAAAWGDYIGVVAAHGMTTLGLAVSGELVFLFVAKEIIVKSSWGLAASTPGK